MKSCSDPTVDHKLCFCCSVSVSSVCRERRRFCTTTAGQNHSSTAARSHCSDCVLFCTADVHMLFILCLSAGQKLMRSTKGRRRSWRPWTSASRNYRPTSWQPIRSEISYTQPHNAHNVSALQNASGGNRQLFQPVLFMLVAVAKTTDHFVFLRETTTKDTKQNTSLFIHWVSNGDVIEVLSSWLIDRWLHFSGRFCSCWQKEKSIVSDVYTDV